MRIPGKIPLEAAKKRKGWPFVNYWQEQERFGEIRPLYRILNGSPRALGTIRAQEYPAALAQIPAAL